MEEQTAFQDVFPTENDVIFEPCQLFPEGSFFGSGKLTMISAQSGIYVKTDSSLSKDFEIMNSRELFFFIGPADKGRVVPHTRN